jgi:Rha family phage regulatory protein
MLNLVSVKTPDSDSVKTPDSDIEIATKKLNSYGVVSSPGSPMDLWRKWKMGRIEKIKSGAVEVFEKDDQLWTTSLDIAEKFGKRHKDVLKAIRNLECPEDFTRRNFAPSRRKTRAGDEEYYIISRDGFTLLAMGFTGKEAIQWKIKYIEAFNKMEKTIIKLVRKKERQLTLEWKQAREDGKFSRRTTTDAIQEFCELAKSQGSQHSHFYYKAFTDAIYDAVIIPGGHKEIDQRKRELKKNNGREVLSLDELVKVELVERLVVKRFLKEASENSGFYRDIYPVVKEKLLRYGELIGKRLVLQMDNQQKGMVASR